MTQNQNLDERDCYVNPEQLVTWAKAKVMRLTVVATKPAQNKTLVKEEGFKILQLNYKILIRS